MTPLVVTKLLKMISVLGEKGEKMRLIDADALAEHKFVGIADWTPTEATSWQRGWNDAIDTIIEAQPTVEVVLDFHAQTPRRGHWEVIDEAEPRRYGCSNCKRLSFTEDNYCSYCGAKMDEVGEDD